MASRHSAGILMYRFREQRLEVFLVHPGGPFWAHKDDGAWSIPKGELQAGEDPLEAARREFFEETGLRVGRLESLGRIEHSYSHFTVDLHLFRGSATDGRRVDARGRPFRWVTREQLRRLPIPRATVKAVDRLATPGGRASRG